ncbi:Uncharacterised protein [Chromobacterium violaceum]|uniref:Uncharacterized protein n=1 Tax=Chromobacterium violaceum TaxID=536 RepID=A0A447TH20_CHRVL|nr:Uncharacterised protein [Chromobacterium violaceum]
MNRLGKEGTVSKWLALCLIRIYQRHLSPRKGFGCAYRAGTGRAGCSGLAFRAIRRYGLRRGAGSPRPPVALRASGQGAGGAAAPVRLLRAAAMRPGLPESGPLRWLPG